MTRTIRSSSHRLALGLLAVILAAGTASTADAADPAVKAHRLVVRGQHAASNGQFETAVRRFRKADEVAGGTSAEALAGLADASLSLGRYEDAIDVADRLLDIATEDEQRVKAHQVTGVSFYRRAQEEVQQEMLAKGACPEMRTGRPRQKAEEEERSPEAIKEEFLSAADAFRRVTELTGGRHAESWLNVAESLTRGGHYDAAREALDQLEDRLAEGQELPQSARALRNCIEVQAMIPQELQLRSVETPGLEPPREIHTPQPQYTAEARQARLGGTVVLWAIIDQKGRLVCPRVVEGLPGGLTRSARDTLSTWTYEPAKLDGAPVAIYECFTVTFQIR